jgi:hypothetical protein
MGTEPCCPGSYIYCVIQCSHVKFPGEGLCITEGHLPITILKVCYHTPCGGKSWAEKVESWLYLPRPVHSSSSPTAFHFGHEDGDSMFLRNAGYLPTSLHGVTIPWKTKAIHTAAKTSNLTKKEDSLQHKTLLISIMKCPSVTYFTLLHTELAV